MTQSDAVQLRPDYMRSLSLLLLLTSSLCAADPFQSHVRPTEALTPQQQQATFELPPGFEIQLVASEPDIQKPLNMAFDTRGRLWVTGSAEYPYAAKGGEGHDAIRVLEDTTGDGRADKITTFADGLNIPMGLYPYKNGVVTYSIPNIWFFADTDGDGRADKRQILYGPLGRPRDTHGLQNAFRRGYDGWLYICHGYANTSTIRGRDGSEVTMQSGNTYRVRLDGSRVEQVTWGQVNPFGMTFLPDGDIVTADCHSKPLTLLLPGAHYSSFGKPHDGLGFAPNLMEHSHGSTAISGVAVISGETFPREMRGDLLVGNVVTCRVHRDKLVYHGSTPRAVEQPDLVSTTDPWFRPVDLRFGPDGALYIADFYNRVIGHYEVPLDHPHRDRHRGRIWRVVYRGDATVAPPTASAVMDIPLDGLPLNSDLVSGLDDPNLTRRMLMTDRLSDHDQPFTPRLRVAIQSPNGPQEPWDAIHSLWVLHRLGIISFDDIRSLARSFKPIARVHALRAASEMQAWNQTHRLFVIDKLTDDDAHVRRAAVQAISRHPHLDSLRPLIQSLQVTDQDDQLLVHALRIALRDHLRDDQVFRAYLDAHPTPTERSVLTPIALAVRSPTAGEFLAVTLAERIDTIPPSTLTSTIRHAARHAPLRAAAKILDIARRSTENDVDLQLELVQAIDDGYRQRNAATSDELRRWAADLAASIIDTPRAFEWTVVGGDIWGLEHRKSADKGAAIPFLSSLPGGEQQTGILKSRDFRLPAQFSFYLCGHRGFPTEPALNGNLVRLRLLENGEVIRRAFPPRNDTATRITWDLKEHAGKPAQLEVVDGLDLSAYAWLAVARFEPPVLSLPQYAPNTHSQQLAAAYSIALRFRLTQFIDDAKETLLDEGSSWQLRATAANTYIALRGTASSNDSSAAWKSLAALVKQKELPAMLRSEICQSIAEHDDTAIGPLAERVMKLCSAPAQRWFADQLLTSSDGAALLLELIEQGHASTRLLRDGAVRDRLTAASIPAVTTRLENLLASAPKEKNLSNVIAAVVAAFQVRQGDVEQGQQLFAKHCATCHQVAGQGTIVGPQLDGIGNRGAERLIEDVLDPNRNVDHTFRTVVLALTDGRIVSGLVRREDANNIALVDKEAKELTIAVVDIEERQQSTTSLMPSDFDAVLKADEMADLFTYLLSLSKLQPSTYPDSAP